MLQGTTHARLANSPPPYFFSPDSRASQSLSPRVYIRDSNPEKLDRKKKKKTNKRTRVLSRRSLCESVVLCRRSPPNHPPPPTGPSHKTSLLAPPSELNIQGIYIYTHRCPRWNSIPGRSLCVSVFVSWRFACNCFASLPSSTPLITLSVHLHIPVYNIAWVLVVSNLFVFEWCQISVLPSLPIMAFKNGLSERLDELRFPSPRSPTSESPFPGYTSLSPGQPNLASAFSSRPAGDVRANLQRRFTTDSSKLSSWSYLNQQPSGPPQVSDPLDLLSSVSWTTSLVSCLLLVRCS